ncbi:DUF167 domain-containing protein [Candidatus Poribacteria bacterium]|nr:DUF167 domain-containing protein [Candidatus Poribacteria bacterium]
MRTFWVVVVAKSSRQALEWLPDGDAKVWVHATRERGKANRELLRVIADNLSVRPSQVRIMTGETSPRKLICVDDG